MNDKILEMTEFKYQLEPYKGISTRYYCPNCKQNKKTFTRYIDIKSNTYLNPIVGRCNRENSCGYHYTPKQYFQDNSISVTKINKNDYSKTGNHLSYINQFSCINSDIFKESLRNYGENYFIKFLIDSFGSAITSELISKYFIGNSNYWEGATVFWQIDITGKIRTGKIMLYDPNLGTRIKEPKSYINWIHKIIKISNFSLRQCLFGEHLLGDCSKLVAIVESEKTAIILSVFFPEFIWLACGGINNINKSNCDVLNHRKVVFFPDLGAFTKWENKVKQLPNANNFRVSNILEIGSKKYGLQNGADLADILICPNSI
jgi:rubredoxin